MAQSIAVLGYVMIHQWVRECLEITSTRILLRACISFEESSRPKMVKPAVHSMGWKYDDTPTSWPSFSRKGEPYSDKKRTSDTRICHKPRIAELLTGS